MMMMPPPFKFASVLVIWVVSAVIVLTMLGGENFNWIFGTVVLGVAMVATLGIFETEKQQRKGMIESYSNESKSVKNKAKRGEGSLAEMVSLLDEDDLYEVRQRIKQRLFDQIDSGSLDEVESFEQLLGSDRQKRK